MTADQTLHAHAAHTHPILPQAASNTFLTTNTEQVDLDSVLHRMNRMETAAAHSNSVEFWQ